MSLTSFPILWLHTPRASDTPLLPVCTCPDFPHPDTNPVRCNALAQSLILLPLSERLSQHPIIRLADSHPLGFSSTIVSSRKPSEFQTQLRRQLQCFLSLLAWPCRIACHVLLEVICSLDSDLLGGRRDVFCFTVSLVCNTLLGVQ